MADIFISYSKADRDLVVTLAAFLEAQGFTTWWDKELAPGDAYRDAIMTELANARAVIVVWTPNSVRSDWVRAEAGRAKADGKLIPVKSTSLAYGDIPLPFGEMHTENLNQTELVRASVVALLAKPSVASTFGRKALKTARYELITWFGVIGGAITVATNLQGLLKLADWVKLLLAHWRAISHAFWSKVLGVFHISLPGDASMGLTYLGLFFAIGIGARMQALQAGGAAARDVRSLAAGAKLVAYKTIMIMGFVVLTLGVADWLGIPRKQQVWAMLLPNLAGTLLFEHSLPHAAFVTIFFAACGWFFPGTAGDGAESSVGGFLLTLGALAGAPIMIALAPARAVSYRLVQLASVLALIFAVSEVSKWVQTLLLPAP